MKKSLAILVTMTLLTTGCSNISTRDALIGATALGAAGAIGYYAGHHKKSGKESSSAQFNQQDLTDMRESQASDQLQQHGFHMVDGWQNDHGNHASFAIWYNDNSHQCLQLKTVHGDVKNASDTRNENCHA
ncbi:hypothetical protein QPK06_02540 [Aeromonas veronii]|uniref:hypothetical protein n=1 Tax=Aeromonas veronii TaxID=654 RepID=UPI000F5FB10A|nr:hypothetical protein [Aeromonas veronii]MCX0424364.1 hypothetical protein [Aeromonas veronii]WIJ42088.1 hypothetical protein QPK06_02540 [Aeromonas veronii]